MVSRFIHRLGWYCMTAVALTIVMSGELRADNLFPVNAGYDLFQTVPDNTIYNGIHFGGVPLGTFDFGSGPVGVGNADTIIQRTQAVNASGGTTNLSVRALQLKSETQVMGHYLYALLDQAAQAAWESDLTHNIMKINATTFDAINFRAWFQIHADSLDGAIVDSGFADLSSNDSPWRNEPPAGAVLIDGVNHNLNGVNENADFWPKPIHNGPHDVITAIPEPSTFALAASGVVALLYRLRRKRGTESV